MKGIKCSISGRIVLKKAEKPLHLKAYVRTGRRTIACSSVEKNGNYKLEFQRMGKSPGDMELVICPPVLDGKLVQTKSKKISIPDKEWKKVENLFQLEKNIDIDLDLYPSWSSREIKVCGIVCKEIPIEGTEFTRCCPVPYAKVEIFDVDSLLLKPVKTPITKIEKMKEFLPTEKLPEIPIPIPPSPKPPPQPPLPCGAKPEKKTVNQAIAWVLTEKPIVEKQTLYADLNVLDKVYPNFLSMQKITEGWTDECGAFCITFDWYPGLLIRDVSPDIIFKVTQIFYAPGDPDADASGMVTKIIYQEAKSDVRWDIPDYFWVKLDADKDMVVACNPNCHPFLDKRALFVGVGNMKIYDDIAQTGDPTRECGFVYNGNFYKSPFGANLDIRGEFGSRVEEMGERWYRLSYAKITDETSKPADNDASAWTPITDDLTDTCYYWDSSTGSLHYETVGLGPHTLPGQGQQFYKIRNTQDSNGHDLYWFDHNKIAVWKTIFQNNIPKIEDGLYVIKIEIFDENGQKDPAVYIGDDYGEFAYLYLAVNNKKPVVDIKQVLNDNKLINEACGSFDHAFGEEVKFVIDAYHPDDHLRYWQIIYKIGYGATGGTVDRKCDGTVWGGTLLEDFRGKENESVVWTNFDSDFGITEGSSPPCSTFGVSIELSAATKTTNGYTFLGSSFEHYKRVMAGLAVHVSSS